LGEPAIDERFFSLNRTILVMAGGTGGHIFPALAVAGWLKERGFRVLWLGTKKGMEATIVPRAGYEIAWVSVGGVRKSGLLKIVTLPFFLLLAFTQAARALRKHRPDVVLGMGGFASFPGGMMAVLFNRPLVIHEQNAIAGLANRVLAGVADKVLVAFPDPFRAKAGFSSFIPRPASLRLAGNPVRPEIAAIPEPTARFAGRGGGLRVLIVGGSRGAKQLNETVPAALRLMSEDARPLVVHQAGAEHITTLQQNYRQAEVEGEILAFIEDMAARLAECDLAICRAGALTIAELAAAGVASVLVPYPHAVDDHQTHNAKYLTENGAAILLPQSELNASRLAELLTGFTRASLLKMATAARSLGKPDATRLVGEACLELAG
jgi:UDP-N-acetylglucosamine--N-acetylmuramyl-(pentapeptide) pyrophosphoryl-undecaprenol N-acetylglucosamine transferase